MHTIKMTKNSSENVIIIITNKKYITKLLKLKYKWKYKTKS